VATNAEELRRRVADRERLLSTLDQAKMQESINAALEQISGADGEQVLTLAEVEHKIEARLARAQGRAELATASADPLDLQMLEIERAQRRSGAQARLDEMRIALGLAAPVIDVASFERRELEP
jgi:phage shock protein A